MLHYTYTFHPELVEGRPLSEPFDRLRMNEGCEARLTVSFYNVNV